MLANILANLQGVLAELYPEEQSARRVVANAELPAHHITFSGRAIDNWANILAEAKKRNKVENLIAVACEEYPENVTLQQISIQYTQETAHRRAIEDQVASADSTPDWQLHEIAGDDWRERALQSFLLSESRDHWLSAKEEYLAAIVLSGTSVSLAKARLHRKLAECSRKLRDPEFAQKQWSQAHDLIKNLAYEPVLDKQLEEARLYLEETYLEFEQPEPNWPRLQIKAEQIIRDYSKSLAPEMRLVIASAYSLLAIALTDPDCGFSKSSPTATKCWEEAKNLLGGLRSSEAKRLSQDIKINRAVYLFDRGNCDSASQELENLLNQHILYAKEPIDILRAERQVEVKHNLAAAYFDKHEPTSLIKAYVLAEENVKAAKLSGDLDNWTWSLQLLLTISTEQIRQASDSVKLDFVRRAEDLYKDLNRAQSNHENKEWEASDNHAELHRLLTEIYLVADQFKQAQQEFGKIKNWLVRSGDDPELCVTRALLLQHQEKFEPAIDLIQRASGLYELANYFGRYVDTQIRLAELFISSSNWREAQHALNKALVHTTVLNCQNRHQRVAKLLEQIKIKTLTEILPGAT